MIWIKLFSSVVVFCSFIFVGKWTAVQISGSQQQVEETARVNKEQRVLPLQNRHPATLSLVKSPPTVVQKARQHLKTIKKDKYLSRLSKALGTDAIGVNLYETLLANSLEGKIEGSQDIRAEGYEKARQNSKQTIERIKNVLTSVNTQAQGVDKLRLLDLAANLQGVDSELQELGHIVMENNIMPDRGNPNLAETEEELNKALSTNFEMLVPVAGLALVLGSTSDSQHALSATLEGIKLQQDLGVQQQMAEAFLQKFPDMSDPLQLELQNNNIIIAAAIGPDEDRSPSSLIGPEDVDLELGGETDFLVDSTVAEIEE